MDQPRWEQRWVLPCQQPVECASLAGKSTILIPGGKVKGERCSVRLALRFLDSVSYFSAVSFIPAESLRRASTGAGIRSLPSRVPSGTGPRPSTG